MKFGGNVENLIKQAGKIKERLEKLQEEIGEKTVEASAGGGMVTATAKARGEIVEIKIDPEIVKEGDIEMLQDLIVAAVNEALLRGRKVMQEEISKTAMSMGLPPGII